MRGILRHAHRLRIPGPRGEGRCRLLLTRLLFGTAGVPDTTPRPRPCPRHRAHLRDLGLDCQEIEFVNGVKMGLDTARKVADAGRRPEDQPQRPRPLLHQPQLRGPRQTPPEPGADPGDGPDRPTPAARESVVFHAGFYGKSSPEQTFEEIKRRACPRSSPSSASERVPGDAPDRDHGQAVPVRDPGRGPEPLPGDRRPPALPRLLPPPRPGGPDQFLRRVPRVLSKVEKKLGRAALEERPHPHLAGATSARPES